MKTKFLLLLLLFTALTPWAAMAQTPNLYTSYTATAGISGEPSQEYPCLVDNNINTKWCVGDDDLSGPDNLDLYIEFYSAEPIIPTGYVLTTGDDNATFNGRNPKDWTIKAKANPNDEWTTIATVINDQVLQDVNLTDFAFTVNNLNLASYQYFRFEVSAIQSGECFQLAELRFNVLNYTATAGVTDYVPQGYPYLVDNDITTKWCVGGFSGPNNLGLYIEFQSSEPIIPTGYVLTTADDNATWHGRNPKDWTIKAKANPNDEWTTIATVTNDQVLQDVNFTDFAFTADNPNLASYQYFRFDVTAIQSGTVFQLAELRFSIYDPCSAPVNLTVGNVSATVAKLNWMGDSLVDNYTVKYRTARFIDPIFAESFDDELNGWTLRNCVNHTGALYGEFLFYYTTNPPQYLISPELTGVTEGMKLEFEYRNGTTSGWDETFQVGFSTTNNATASFTFGEVITASGMERHRHSVTIPAGTKYICWKHTSNDQYVLFLDNIVVGTEVPAGEWQTATVAGNATEVCTTLTGLTPATLYDACVYPDCNPDNVSQTVNFTTKENPCPTPTDFTASNVTATTADFNWSSAPEVESYTVEYQSEQYFNVIFSEGFEDDLDDWTLRDCVSNTGISTAAASSGNAGFSFYNSATPQYLISPELTGVDEDMVLYFRVQNNGAGDLHQEIFHFGYSTTDNATESFTFEKIYTLNGAMVNLLRSIPAGTKYVCWKYASDNCQLHIDDISLGYDVPAGEYQTITVEGGDFQMSITLTGLTPNTPYQANVSSSCNTTTSSLLEHFTTTDACPTPVNFAVSNIGVNSADLSWTGEVLVDSYTVKYKPAFYTVLNEGFENGIDNWTLRDCGSSTGVENNFPAGAHSGNAFFHFWATSDTPQYFISPELTGIEHGMTLDFYYSANGPDIQYFQVGFSSSFNTNESFTFGETITIYDYNQWHQLSLAIPADTKYICWKFTPNVHYGFNLDDIMVSMGNSASEWQTAHVAGNATELGTSLIGLIPETPYVAYVYPDCNPGNVSETVMFVTEEETPPTLPYSTDFETAFDWSFVNDSCTNAWSWGTAAYNGEGTHGLYISNDGGTTNAYTNTSDAIVYAYKTFHLDAGGYIISYDWNAKGENNYDFLRVALVPASVSLEAGTSVPTGFNYNTLPEGWIALDGGLQLTMATDWQTVSQEIGIATAGNYRIVFAWCNDYADGTNPPAAIDNVSIDVVTCPALVNLNVSNITSITTDLGWSVSMPTDSYTVKYRTAQSVDAIFAEGFENGIGDWTLLDCHPNTGIDSNAARSGDAGFRFRFNTNPPQYLISPELPGVTSGMRLKFFYKNYYSSYPETFQVGFSATDNETASFTFGDEITVSDQQWHLYSETIPAGTKYICWKYNSNDKFYLYLDDIAIGTEAPASEWQTATVAGNATEVKVTLTDLTPETEYEAFVYPDCDPDKVTETVLFATDVACPTPKDLSVKNIRSISANLSWTGDPGVESYTAKYRTSRYVNAIFAEGFENGIGDWTLLDCHSSTGIDSYATHSGNAGFCFYYNTNPPQYLISPELTGVTEGMKLEFYYRNKSTNFPETFQIGFSTTDNETASFTFGDTITAADMLWHLYSEMIPTGTKYICWKLNSNDQYCLYLDDIAVGTEIPAGEWQTATATGNATEVSVMLTNLNPETTYEAYIYPDCDPDMMSETANFTTTESPIPYFTDFETSCDWTLVNGDRNNVWVWGTAAHHGEGTQSLYISNDGGATNAYEYVTNNIGTVVYAYKSLDFMTGLYEFSYDWRANGWSFTDYLRVALVPDSDTLQASRMGPVDLNFSSLPAGWIALDGGSKLNLSTEWQTENRIIEVPTGTYKMAFIWIDRQFQLPANPPAAIDNVSVEVATCARPENLTASNISAHAAKLNWDVMVATDSYTVKYRPTFVPMNESFENGLGDWTIRNGGNNTGLNLNVYNDKHSGGRWFHFHPTSSAQYLISPVLTGIEQGMRLDFYYASQGPSNQSFQVGFSSTNNATTSFTFGETITTGDYQWHHLYLAIPAGTKYICWKWIPNGEYGLNLDDIMVSREAYAGEWLTTTVENDNLQVSALITGLSPETEYEAMVYPDCDPDKVSNTVYFTTGESSVFSMTISGYGTTDDNWHLIASPVIRISPDNVEGMTTSDYDLYRFNPLHNDNEWENYKDGSFNLEAGKGYLYARSTDATLTFVEMPYSGNGEFALTYDANDEHKCWNLVGNPFNGEAYLDREYYVLNADSTGINPVAVPATTPIPPCTAVFVKAVANGDKAVFTKVTP